MPQFLANVGASVANMATDFLGQITSSWGANEARDIQTPNMASNYNLYQDMTYGEDTRRMGERMDSLFPGTSPWERLGSSAGGKIEGTQVPETRNNPAILQAQTAKYQADTQAQTARDVALIQGQTNRDVATISSDASRYGADTHLTGTRETNVTSRENVGMQTNNGQVAISETQLKEAQTELARYQQALVNAERIESTARTGEAEARTRFVEGPQTDLTRSHTFLNTQVANTEQVRQSVLANDNAMHVFSTVMQNMPTDNINLGTYSSTEKRGWQIGMELLKDMRLSPTRPFSNKAEGAAALRTAVTKLPAQDQDAWLAFIAKAMAGPNAAMDLAGKTASTAFKMDMMMDK